MSNLAIECCPPGKNMTLYFDKGTHLDPIWTEHVGMIEDLNMSETEDVQEMSSRRRGRFVKEYNDGDIEVAIAGTQICDPDYEGWQALYAARNGGLPVHALCLTGLLDEQTCSTGWGGDWWNSDRSFNGPQTGNLTSVVNLQPAAPCGPEETIDPVHTIRGDSLTGPVDYDAREPWPVVVPGP